MRKFYCIATVVLATMVIGFSWLNVKGQVNDTLSMSPGYANDIFYSLENGEVSNIARATWDIAFYTPRISAGIIVNDGSGAMLFTYPNGDTSDWSNIDTTGMLTWKQMYNSAEIWEEGAFNVNAKGHPDYGWGWYNMADHSVYGDSIYIIHYPGPEGWTKKLWIKKKISVGNIYHFSYADIDGENQHDVEMNVAPYETKRFAYYSLENNEELDREPAKGLWDILFTKYVDMVPDLEGNLSPYIVTGATSNVDIGANNFYPVNAEFDDWSAKPMDSLKNKVGYNWKSFDMGTFSWKVKDSNYYFVQSYSTDVYKLKFQAWSGSSTGEFILTKSLASASSVFETPNQETAVRVYPNPASSQITLKVGDDLSGFLMVNIYDQTGRTVFQNEVSASELKNGHRMNTLSLPEGLYIIQLSGNNYFGNTKLLIR